MWDIDCFFSFRQIFTTVIPQADDHGRSTIRTWQIINDLNFRSHLYNHGYSSVKREMHISSSHFSPDQDQHHSIFFLNVRLFIKNNLSLQMKSSSKCHWIETFSFRSHMPCLSNRCLTIQRCWNWSLDICRQNIFYVDVTNSQEYSFNGSNFFFLLSLSHESKKKRKKWSGRAYIHRRKRTLSKLKLYRVYIYIRL